jgi:ribosomal protein S18 acetylase RimI-like enzyme
VPVFEVVDQNLRDAMQCYAFCSPDGQVQRVGGVVLTSSGVNYSVFNSAMLTAPVETPNGMDLRIRLAEVHFAARGLGWSYWICEDLCARPVLRSFDTLFADHNMQIIAQPPGMYADRLWPREHPPADLKYRRVEDARTRFDFSDVASVVFSLPFVVSERIYGAASTWNSNMTGWVAYVAEKSVGIVSTVVAGGAIGIYSLGTLPDCRRAGYGESLLRHALERAQEATGIQASVLQSTKAGLSLYRKLGYKPVTRFVVYHREAGGSL